MGINVQTMEAAPFGQLAEQVIAGKGEYDQRTRGEVFTRLMEVGEVVGRYGVIQAWHDGEVGPQVIVVPHDQHTPSPDRPIYDPLSQGV